MNHEVQKQSHNDTNNQGYSELCYKTNEIPLNVPILQLP